MGPPPPTVLPLPLTTSVKGITQPLSPVWSGYGNCPQSIHVSMCAAAEGVGSGVLADHGGFSTYLWILGHKGKKNLIFPCRHP